MLIVPATTPTESAPRLGCGASPIPIAAVTVQRTAMMAVCASEVLVSVC
jgi:hypothetical protein